jgi:hypothetical protein
VKVHGSDVYGSAAVLLGRLMEIVPTPPSRADVAVIVAVRVFAARKYLNQPAVVQSGMAPAWS